MDSKNPRLIATKILFELIQNKISFAKSLENISGLPNHGLIQELCYGVTRWYFQLDFLAKQLLKKSLKRKDQDIYILILVGIYQLLYTDIPSYAVVSETVNTVREFNKKWATDLVNGILRNFLRKQKELLNKADQNPVAKYSHPKWLIERVQKVWPEHWQDILLSNNQHPPMSLRVNRRMITKEAYFEKLETHATDNPHCPMCLTLEKPCPTYQLPGFSEGEVSVQDCGAQLAIDLLEIKPKQRILDACAAPGGKTTHILEVQPDIQTLISIDKNESRLNKIQENLNRLHLNTTLVCADIKNIENWWDGQLFDRILLDAPCSATGVIRRHPDIKLLRQPSDIKPLAKTQLILLASLWPLLKSGGRLVYVTCSILPKENQEMISRFLEQSPDAQEFKIEAKWGYPVNIGRQILSGQDDMDGFYYAVLCKS